MPAANDSPRQPRAGHQPFVQFTAAEGVSIIGAMGPARTDELDGARAPREPGPPALGHADVARLVAIAAFALITLLLVSADVDSPVRVALTIAFLLFGPGLALAELLAVADPLRRLTLAIGASIAAGTLVATLLLYLGLFSAEGACGILVGLTCLALLGAAWRRGHEPAGLAPDDPSATAT